MSGNNRSRVHDLFNKKEWEVKLSIINTILFFGIFVFIELYQNFSRYENAVENLSICFLGAFIGLLGFSLSGISIIVSLFSKEESTLISKLNGKEKIEDILTSYSFLAENIGVQCFALIVIYFSVLSDRELVPSLLFYFIAIAEIYHLSFIIFYTVALVINCIELYKIKNIYGQIDNAKKTLHETINEIKIDYIFSTLVNNYGCTIDEVIDKLILFVEQSDVENKDQIIRNIKAYYGK